MDLAKEWMLLDKHSLTAISNEVKWRGMRWCQEVRDVRDQTLTHSHTFVFYKNITCTVYYPQFLYVAVQCLCIIVLWTDVYCSANTSFLLVYGIGYPNVRRCGKTRNRLVLSFSVYTALVERNVWRGPHSIARVIRNEQMHIDKAYIAITHFSPHCNYMYNNIHQEHLLTRTELKANTIYRICLINQIDLIYFMVAE